jgi:hypothetical protein
MELRLRPVLLVLLPLLPLLPALYTAPSLRRLATQQAAPHLPSDIWKTCSELSQAALGASRGACIPVFSVLRSADAVFQQSLLAAGGGKYPVRIDSVSLYPDPPKRGRRLSLLAELRLGGSRSSPHHHTQINTFALLPKGLHKFSLSLSVYIYHTRK